MAIKVNVDGQTFDTEDLTINEAVVIEQDSGHGWLSINPWRSAADARAILIAFKSRTAPREVVVGQVDAMRVNDLIALFEWVDDDPKAPADEAAPAADSNG